MVRTMNIYKISKDEFFFSKKKYIYLHLKKRNVKPVQDRTITFVYKVFFYRTINDQVT